MGQAKLRGSRDERVKQAEEVYVALTPEQKKQAEWTRLPRSQLRRVQMAAAINLVAEILTSPAKS